MTNKTAVLNSNSKKLVPFHEAMTNAPPELIRSMAVRFGPSPEYSARCNGNQHPVEQLKAKAVASDVEKYRNALHYVIAPPVESSDVTILSVYPTGRIKYFENDELKFYEPAQSKVYAVELFKELSMKELTWKLDSLNKNHSRTKEEQLELGLLDDYLHTFTESFGATL